MSGLMDAEWQMLADAAEHTADASCWKRGCEGSLPCTVERIIAAREVEAGRQALRDAADAARGVYDPVDPECAEWAAWLTVRANWLAAVPRGERS